MADKSAEFRKRDVAGVAGRLPSILLSGALAVVTNGAGASVRISLRQNVSQNISECVCEKLRRRRATPENDVTIYSSNIEFVHPFFIYTSLFIHSFHVHIRDTFIK